LEALSLKADTSDLGEASREANSPRSFVLWTLNRCPCVNFYAFFELRVGQV
jgi:hypothetical protein